ncbi:DUF2934 domain-containing protein [Bradyrhizobium sp.]|uniref:DUF2934 domain-containing protein n=1 Tax=Bradyrhizobium sp. TaxID=376 RepID=UPI003C44A6BE
MPNLDETIRERAYHLWIADGQPEGNADIYWLNAQREILVSAVESPVSDAAAAPAAKPAKKTRLFRSKKAKTEAKTEAA